MAPRLRQARVTDLPAIYRGEHSYIQCWEPAHEAAWQAQVESHLTRWVENFERMTVAVIGEHFAGYSLWAPQARCATLCTLGVLPAYRRSGIGRALLDAYAEAAAKQGFTRLTLSVRPDNPARWLYENTGFMRTGTDAHGYWMYERTP
jgi:ribosomal-protein-alanine N-acetyltransferase